MKSLIACMLLVVSTIAEPPVDSRYLPPQQGGFGSPSSTYGAPGSGGHGRQTAAIFGARQNAGSRRPSSQYGAPSSQYGAPSSQFAASSSQFGAPSSQYRGPSQFGGSFAPSSSYGAPSLSNQYGAPNSGGPSNQYGAPGGSGAPSSQYGAPDAQARPSALYGAPSSGARGFSGQSGRAQTPSQQYGAPGFGGNGGSGYNGGEQSRQYLPPGAGGAGGYGGEDGNGEPASYSFEYMVKDDPSGNDFGHREAREGDRAEGLYYVVLPDGRKQTVEYEADQGGYRPKISYEDTGAGAGGYGGQGYGGQGGPY